MTSIYVIEIVIEQDVITPHMFLTEGSAYRKFIELIGEYAEVVNPMILEIQLIRKDIDDNTGFTTDTLLDKTDFRKPLEETLNENVDLYRQASQ